MKIENEFCSAEFNERGEITSYILDGVEHIWGGCDAEFWSWSSPILFPYIGRLKDGRAVIDGEVYKLDRRHGFGRNLKYEVKCVDDRHVEMTATSSLDTMAVYPFPFTIKIDYVMGDLGYICTATITNDGSQEMPFCIGMHPAFMLPGEIEDCFLVTEATEYFAADGNGLLIEDKPFGVVEGGVLPFSMELFSKDGIFFPEVGDSRVLVVLDGKKNRGFGISLLDYPAAAVWIPAGKRAPFVSVEPWCGLPDSENSNGNFLSKPYVQLLSPGESRRFSYLFKPMKEKHIKEFFEDFRSVNN